MLSPMILNLNQMQNLWKTFPVPCIHELTFKQELNLLEYLKVIKKVNCFHGGAPTFLIPKEDSTVCFISEIRDLNKRILCQQYPMPKIQDLLLRLEGFHSGTILDINMGYYHMNSCSNKNSINSSILRLKRKLSAPKGAHQHFLHRRRDEHQKCFDATKCMIIPSVEGLP